MSRRRALKLLLAPPCAALCVSCAGDDGGGPKAVVRIGNAASPPAGPPGVTPTPVPPPELVFSTERIYQAGASLVSLVGEAASGSITFLGRSYGLTQGARSIYAFVAAGAEDATGLQPLKVDFTLKSGSKGSLMGAIEVLETNWTSDAITVPPSMSALLDERVSAGEVRQLASCYGPVTSQKLWTDGWQMPVNGPVTTRFGEERSYNGGPVSGHHLGTDIGANDGAPVGSTNGGRVIYARQLQLRGNMVVVDHGGGLFSGYAHLKSFAVTEGQSVEKGETVGFVGSTGLSTGAHLHWEMAAGGVLVDALRFADGSNGF